MKTTPCFTSLLILSLLALGFCCGCRPATTTPSSAPGRTPGLVNSTHHSDNVTSQPMVTQPMVTQPMVTQPVVTQPVVTQPVVTQPMVTQPMVTQPVVTRPAAQPIVSPPRNAHTTPHYPRPTPNLAANPTTRTTAQPGWSQPAERLSTQPTQTATTRPRSVAPLPTFNHAASPQNDAMMRDAINRARSTFSFFESNWQTLPSEAQSVKFAFNTANQGTEAIWFSPIRFEGEFITAQCSNQPVDVPNLNMGDTIKISRNKVVDWMILMANNQCYGGYTIRVQAKRAPDSVPHHQYLEPPQN